jgi:hypothetical protein
MQSGHAGTKLLILVLQFQKEFHNNNFLVNRGIAENNFIVFLQMTLIIRVLNYSNLLSGHAFFPCDEYMRDEYLIRNIHRTFRAWLLPFSFVGGQP